MLICLYWECFVVELLLIVFLVVVMIQIGLLGRWLVLCLWYMYLVGVILFDDLIKLCFGLFLDYVQFVVVLIVNYLFGLFVNDLQISVFVGLYVGWYRCGVVNVIFEKFDFFLLYLVRLGMLVLFFSFFQLLFVVFLDYFIVLLGIGRESGFDCFIFVNFVKVLRNFVIWVEVGWIFIVSGIISYC